MLAMRSMLGLNTQDDNQCYTNCYLFAIPCYGYALNIISSTAWTYPGMRYHATNPPISDCNSLKALVVQDGATEIFSLEDVSSTAHVFAAFMGPTTYHFVRRDVDTQTWSSKNGNNEPSQLDTYGTPITDITKAKFNLGEDLALCGLFTVSNVSDVCPTDADCVHGENPCTPCGTSSGPYSGCGLPTPVPSWRTQSLSALQAHQMMRGGITTMATMHGSLL